MSITVGVVKTRDAHKPPIRNILPHQSYAEFNDDPLLRTDSTPVIKCTSSIDISKLFSFIHATRRFTDKTAKPLRAPIGH